MTAYYHNPRRPPFSLETAIEDIPVRPGLPILDLTTQSEFGDTVSCTQVAGPPCDGTVEVTVVDPSLVTGHSYVLDVEGSAEDPVFSLTDTDAGVILFDRQSVPTGRSVSRMADGLSVRLENPPPGFNLSRGMYASLGEGFGGFDLEGDPYITGVKVMGGSSFFHGAKPGFDFLGSTLAADEYTDCRIDFWNDDHHSADPISCPWSVCSVYHFLSDTVWAGTGIFPGAAYDTDDPDHPRRVNLCFAESDRRDFFWDPLAADSGNGQGGREYLFVMNSDYTEDPAIFYNETLFGPSLDVNCVLWAMPARRDASPAQEFNIRFWMNHPFENGHRYAFDASGFEALRDEAVTRERLSEIQVFPNPYFGSQMDEQGLRERFVTFTHLPESCTIRVFSISGNLVKTIVHSDGTAFEKWDLSNTDGLTVASALYVVHIQTRYGTRILKLCIINREDPVLRM